MNYNNNQLTAINANGNIVTMASAGSGKTSVIIERTKRLINDGVDPTTILLITFSHKAKDTLIERLNNEAVNIETFHSFGLKVIKDKYENKYEIWLKQWEKEKVIQDLLKELGLFNNQEPNQYLKTCFGFIAHQKHLMLEPKNKLDYKGYDELTESEYKTIYRGYETYKKANNFIEFDDFLNIVYKIFNKDKGLLSKYQNQYKYIMADEFQDVSINQALVLRQLNKDNTMIVGDPLQAIYAFRGGQSKFILDFDKDYDNVTVVNLDTNYRCKQSIVEASNKFAAEWIPDTKHHNYVESKANRGGGFKPEIKSYSSSTTEGNNIGKKIKESNWEYKDIAILARTNAQLQKIQNGLVNNEIPFQVIGGGAYTDQAEIKLLLSYLRLANDTNDNEAFTYMYNKPNRWLGKKFLEEVHANCYGCSYYDSMDTIARRNWKFKNGINDIMAIITTLQRGNFNNVGEMIKYIREICPIDDYFNKEDQSEGEYNEKIESMDAFQDTCKRFENIDSLLKYMEMIGQSNDANSVKLMTIHKSKGMEFPIVFIIGLDNDHMPHYMSDDIADEARIMYVGMTRAADELYMSYVDEPSIFLDIQP